MSANGDSDLLVRARTALLDALDALAAHRDALILIGAQAIYLQTDRTAIALAEATKDSDLAIDPRRLAADPRLEAAMTVADFHCDPVSPQPGGWLTAEGIPVDLMVPEALAGPRRGRSVQMPPHDRHSARQARGLEAAIVDHTPMEVAALRPDDTRRSTVNVAGPAALLVAKLHKIGERRATNPARLVDKDAHDAYRLLVAFPTHVLADRLRALRTDELAGDATREALVYLDELFARGPGATGSEMAGRAEELVGAPDVVAAASAALAGDLLERLD